MPRPNLDMVIDCGVAKNRKFVAAFVDSCRGQYEFKIAPRRFTRSTKQNNMYWALCEITGKEMGEQEFILSSKDAAHEWFRSEFLRVPLINRETGEELGTFVRSTASLSTEEFVRYFDACLEMAIRCYNVNWNAVKDRFLN